MDFFGQVIFDGLISVLRASCKSVNKA
jgi:hypothetical protein